MHADQNYLQLLLKLAEANQPSKKRWIKFRETLDTAILGTISTAVGTVALIVVIECLATGYKEGLHDRLGPVPDLGIMGIAVIVGEGLGLAGLALGKLRDGTISPLSAIGTIVGLIGLYFGQFVVVSHLR